MAASASGETPPSGGHQHTNRLSTEASPYLLQHAHNPVDWLPWGPEALERAKREDKPIFLSVGYSTCHWCHVMERESFESEDVAALMNASFVNIKVDREERPDVDRIYMAYVQGTTGSGGWPMSVFLSPELEPLYGGTYYPPEDMMSAGVRVRPGFKTVLRRVAQLWGSQKDVLRKQGASIMSQLRDSLVGAVADGGGASTPDSADQAIRACVQQLGRRFDKELGGFGGAPKFPRPSEINVLLRAHLLQQASGEDGQESEYTLHMALMTLRSMAAGGMRDHVGGGFARYSVDEFWHVPHFEKMLYDQTQLASSYINAFQLTGDTQYARVARDVLDYLRRDMTAPGGGIYSAEDADSLDTETGTKSEGAFYLWTASEIRAVLGDQHAAIFARAYYVKEEGNCTLSERSDPHGEFGGKNCLMQRRAIADVATQARLSVAELEQLLAECRVKLHVVRAQRPRPSLDDKVVTAWNGLAISALALVSRSLAAESPPCSALFPVDGVSPRTYLEAACRAATFLRDELYDPATNTLRRGYCRGPSAVPGFADDYAYLISGLLDLYECGGGTTWLQWALQLQEQLDATFWDEDGGGYFSTSGTDTSIILRMKDDYDGAEPTASSVAAGNLFRFAALVPGSPGSGSGAGGGSGAGDAASTSAAEAAGAGYQRRGERTLGAFHERLTQAALAVPQLCCAAYLHLQAPLRQVIIAGRLEDEETQRLVDAAHANFTPDKVVLLMDPQDAACMDFWRRHSPEAHAMVQTHFARGGVSDPAAATAAGGGPVQATAFICQNFTCQAPTSDPSRVRALLMPTVAGPRGGGRKGGPTLTPMTGLKL